MSPEASSVHGESVSAPRVDVDGAGVHVPVDVHGVMDVLFDGRRIWSFLADRHEPDGSGRRTVPWPSVLEGLLDGTARVTVHAHAGDASIFDEEIVFGTGNGRVSVVDSHGRPVAVTKWGRLNHPFDSVDREALDSYLDQVEDVLAVLRDECGLPAFLSWGSLLGAVRSGQLIGHDVDVDLGYLSAHEHPADVARESFRVERALRGHGWSVRRENSGFLALFFNQADGTLRNLDVFVCWTMGDWLYQVHDIRTKLPRTTIVPLSEVQLEGRWLPAPADPPALLEAAYGPTWRVPDPAFTFRSPRSTKRRIAGWYGGLRARRDRWAEHYAGRHQPPTDTEPSSFARWVAEKDDPSRLLVDVGSGDGRDALWFARSGRDVVGVDFVPSVVRSANRTAREQQLSARFELLNLYDLRHALALGARAARWPPRSICVRGLLEDLTPAGRDHFWRFARMSLDRGGRLFVEVAAGPAEGHFDLAEMTDALPDARVVEDQEVPGHDGARQNERARRVIVEWSR